MQKHKNGVKDSMENLVDDARELLMATADVTGDKVTAARERVAAALESAKDAYGEARKKVVAGAKETDRMIRDNPYQAMGIALGLGVLLGLFWRRRN